MTGKVETEIKVEAAVAILTVLTVKAVKLSETVQNVVVFMEQKQN